MIKKITLFAFAALLIGALAQASTSPKPATTAKSMTATKATTRTVPAPRIEGTIQSIDAKKNTLTVMAGADTKTFQMSSKTAFLMNGKKAAKVDLKSGEEVSISADSKNVAHIIEVKQ